MFYLTTHSTHFIYGYMASVILLRTILIVRKETLGYSYRLTARVLLYARSHRQENTYHGLCYTSRGALAGLKLRCTDWKLRQKARVCRPHLYLRSRSSCVQQTDHVSDVCLSELYSTGVIGHTRVTEERGQRPQTHFS